MKRHDIEKRAVLLGKHIVAKKSTVRDTADIFGVSKYTVHIDITKRLERINPFLASRVREVVDFNWKEKHIRGGNATCLKYRKLEQARLNN